MTLIRFALQLVGLFTVAATLTVAVLYLCQEWLAHRYVAHNLAGDDRD